MGSPVSIPPLTSQPHQLPANRSKAHLNIITRSSLTGTSSRRYTHHPPNARRLSRRQTPRLPSENSAKPRRWLCPPAMPHSHPAQERAARPPRQPQLPDGAVHRTPQPRARTWALPGYSGPRAWTSMGLRFSSKSSFTLVRNLRAGVREWQRRPGRCGCLPP